MGATMERDVAEFDLGERYEAVIARELASGRFATAADVVRAGLALLDEQHIQRKADRDRLVREIAEALDDPRPSIPADEVFDRIERELEAEIRREAEGRARAEGA